MKSLNIPAPFQRSQSRLRVIESLFDLYPQAALLLDLTNNHVVIANAKATEMTTFTRNELLDQEISTLFPEWNENGKLHNFETQTNSVATVVARHNGPPIEALVTLNRLDSPSSWVFATLLPAEVHQKQQAERVRLSQRKQALEDLLSAIQEPDLKQAMSAALEAGQALIGASILSIYLADAHSPELRYVDLRGMRGKLPPTISPNDGSTLQQSTLWMPGKRATNDLQRTARAARFSYLASSPLGNAQALNGLVVVADPNLAPPDDILEQVQLLATALSTIIQQHTLADNLRNQQKAQEHNLFIGHTIHESVQDGIILVTPDLTIQEMNPSVEWMLGYAAREVAGMPIENVLVGAENLIPALQDAQRNIPTYNLGSVHIHRRDGRTFLAHIRILPVNIADILEGIVILVRDLSEQEQFQARSQQLEQRALLGEVTAIFAHEVRNPINNISTGLQLMADNLPADDPQRALISRLEIDCNRLTHLMQSVLAFSRPVETKTEAVDLGSLLERLIERWRPRLSRVDVHPLLTNKAQGRFILGDPRSLEQVFANLFSNAVEAMSNEGGLLVINLRMIPSSGGRDQIEVSISDNGPGIPEEIRERIFEPFFTTTSHGTGLGLSIAKRIVTAHKGTINVTSVPGGTVFQIIFPAFIS